MTELSAMAQAYRAGDASGGALPHGAHLRLRGVEGSLPDIGAGIADHRNQIARSVMAQFIQLGTSEGAAGHRALGQTFLDFFALGIDSIATTICDTTTQHVVEDWVDLNYGPDEPAPQVHARPATGDVEFTAEQLAALADALLITPDLDLEAELRRRFNLPPRGDQITPRPAVPEAAAARARLVRGSARAQRRRIVAQSEPPPGAEDSIADALEAMVDVDTAIERWEAADEPQTASDQAVSDDTSALEAALLATWTASYYDGVEGGYTDRAGLGQLTEELPERAGGIRDTLRDRIASALGNAREEDVSASALRGILDAIGSDRDRASLIATTETRRAAVLGALDSWRLMGVTATRWLRTSGSDLDDDCAARNGTTAARWSPPPPIHPRCQCTLEPA